MARVKGKISRQQPPIVRRHATVSFLSSAANWTASANGRARVDRRGLNARGHHSGCGFRLYHVSFVNPVTYLFRSCDEILTVRGEMPSLHNLSGNAVSSRRATRVVKNVMVRNCSSIAIRFRSCVVRAIPGNSLGRVTHLARETANENGDLMKKLILATTGRSGCLSLTAAQRGRIDQSMHGGGDGRRNWLARRKTAL